MRLPHSLAFALALAIARPLSAQDETAAADSARVARTAWGKAARALRDGSLADARRELDRAAAAWPTQPYYRWQQVLLSAKAHDTAALRDQLQAFARMGLGVSLEDSAFGPYRHLSWFDAVRDRNAANLQPIPASRPHAQLRTPTLWPEGVDIDPSTGVAYVTSIRRRTIVVANPNGDERMLWPLDSGPGAVLAVRHVPNEEALWATIAALPQMTGYAPRDSGIAALVKVRISDGAVLRRVDLPMGRHVPGDLAITRSGDVFVSDSHQPVLYRLRAGADTFDAIRHPLFRSLQGIAIDPAGRIFVADYSHGLLRVDPVTGDVRRLGDAPHSTALGCDGIAWHDGAIIAIQNGVSPTRVMRFTLNAAADSVVAATVIDRNTTIADEPTLGVVVGDEFYYIANSHWEKYSETGEVRPGAMLRPPVILRLRLKL